MNRRIFYIIILVSFFVQAESILELIIYDEVAHLSKLVLFISYLVFVLYTIVQFTAIFSLDIVAIKQIEKSFPWDTSFFKRIFIEFFSTSLIAAIVTVPFTIYISHGLIMPFFNIPSEGMKYAVFYNLLYILAYNLIFVITYEGVYLYGERKNLQLEWEQSQKQNILSQFDALKNQVNPHFLFNSMNALSNLIKSDPKQALKFTKEFSNVFRYTLELKDNIVISLAKELEFVNAYLYMQKIRFGKNLKVDIDIDSSKLNEYIPPFSLQLLIENALKHNVISSDEPLLIEIKSNGNILNVSNNLQLRNESVKSTKIGQTNLEERYKLISDRKPSFSTNGDSYLASIPILSEDQVN